MENLGKSYFTEKITVDAHTIRPGDVFLVAGWRAEVTAVDIRGEMIDIYYSFGGSNQQVGEFATFVDGPFTLISHKTVLEIYITKKELGVLNEQAAALDISRSELIRGVLDGTYSIKDALGEDDLTNYTESIPIIAPTSMIEALGDIAYDANISRSQAVRDILYERL